MTEIEELARAPDLLKGCGGNCKASCLAKPDWRFFVSLLDHDEELVKGERKRYLRGVASTEREDLHGEEVLLAGMDFAPYLKCGRLNYDHLKGAQHQLGKPIEAKLVPDAGQLRKGLKGPGFYHVVEMYDTEPGRAAWDLVKSERDDPDRNFGFSVEGAILETRGRQLTKTRVDDVGLCPRPANTDTFAEFLQKSLIVDEHPELELQNLDNGQYDKRSQALTGFPLEIVLWGDCQHNCYDEKGRFRKGAQSALFHLVKCRGVDENDAFCFVSRLKNAGYLK
jgi:hypothetical protein